MTHVIICYRQYGDWYSTMPFKSRRDAERHVDLRLRRPDRDYITDITFVDVELPK